MIKLAARAGIIGLIMFGFVVTTLTVIKYEFLLSLGWHPIQAPTFDWPSGLALGDYGWIMTATFLLTGLMMTFFATGLRLSLPPSRVAYSSTLALSLAGIALAGLAFTTDPTLRTVPRSWHGWLHDLSFVLLGLSLLPGMILLGFAFRQDTRWRNHSWYTWLTVAFAIPTFWMKGAAFYIFLLAVVAWGVVTGRRLNSLAN